MTDSRRDHAVELRPVASIALLPSEQPLSMPVQDLDFWAGPKARPQIAAEGRRARVARVAVFGMAAILTLLFALKLHSVLAVHEITPLQIVFLILCTMSFAWVVLGSVSALAGCFVHLKPDLDSELRLPEGRVALTERTALLFPIYHEEPARIAATVEAIGDELIGLGADKAFDFFILSDSRGEEAHRAELRAFRALAERLSGRINVYYRQREQNTAKKAGNIHDWIERFGAGYEHFIILDADSIMSGTLIVQLSAAMQQRPRLGLLQTVPRLVGSQTIFARLQQFAAGVYGPVVASGIALWHRGQGNYWGHNAIIRTRAFAESAGLPILPGRAPFGGPIQSHDFVEAALLQRAGWEVRMVADARGSYEGCPPSLVDLVVRDRRWAQGNLQHIRLLRAAGLTGMSRTHLGMGALAYLASVLWAASLVVGLILALQSKYYLPSYFGDEPTLFPHWPEMDSVAAFTLLLATFFVVMLPKIVGLALGVRSRAARTRNGGAAALTGGVLVETGFSMLVAPILMLTQSTAVFQILLGRDSGWKAQRRDDGSMLIKDAWKFHRWHVVIGAIAALLCWQVSPQVTGWMAPILLGLTLSVGLTWWTSRVGPAWLDRALKTEEDLSPPTIVAAANQRLVEWRSRLAAGDGEPAPRPNNGTGLPRAA